MTAPPFLCCLVDGCDKPQGHKHGGLCSMHAYRKRRGIDMQAEPRVRYETRREMLLEAAFTFLELRPTDDDGWRRAIHRLCMAARRYTLHTKK